METKKEDFMSRCRFCHKHSPAHAQHCPHDKPDDSDAMQDWMQGCREAEQGEKRDKSRLAVASAYALGWFTGQIKLLKPSM